jgi:acyl-CoA reductase-like NAD-dependent aldehyde dehydrogenase
MPNVRFLIDGTLVDGESNMPVVNPATGAPFATAPRASPAQVERAVAAAVQAHPDWSGRPLAERRAVLLRIADIIDANRDELTRLLTMEQGKPLAEAGFEVMICAMMCRIVAGLDLPGVLLEDNDNRRVDAYRRSLGVVAVITPWNVPLAMFANKVPAALLAGNTVVLKPAGTTPLSSLRLGELIVDAVPPGVVNVIADANDLGDLLTAHPNIRKISFTGSTATGRRVMASAAPTLKRLTLELGGNDAGIVLDDASPATVAPLIFQSAFANSGQICAALTRLYVHESIYDDLVTRLTELASAAIVGDGLAADTQFGPVQNKAQFERVKALIEDGRAHGTVLTGGVVSDSAGYFIRPTIVRDITDGTRLVDEEQFGPVLPVIKFSDVQDVIRRVNSSAYGLGGSVWSSDRLRAAEIARQLECGTVWVNKHLDLDPHIPFGGAKSSGIGVEFAEEGLHEFTQLQIINVAK